jgi:hypothetical protein
MLVWLLCTHGAMAKDKGAAQADALFSGGQVLSVQIEVAEEDIEILRNEKRRTSTNLERSNVVAVVREGGNVYRDVMLHLKGSGSFRGVDLKPNFTLNFDQVHEKQRFHGLEKISLNNSVHDASFLCEALGRPMFLEAGVPVPRVAHATVSLNGRALGVYVLVEGWNKQFLKRHFADVSGNFYERGPGGKEVTEAMEVKSGREPEDRSALAALVEAMNESDHGRRWSALERTLDVDRFMTFIAMEILISHWDGYCRNQNNFRVFHDRAQDRLVFMPHGMDQLFGVRGGSAEIFVMPQMRGLVAAAVLETQEGRRRYLARMEQLHAKVYDVAALTNRVNELAALLQPHLEDGEAGVLRTNRTAVDRLLERIPQRHAYVGAQLARLKTVLPPGGTWPMTAERWESRRDTGSPTFTKTGPRSSQLQVSSTKSVAKGSWRAVVLLEPGRYRFQGNVTLEETGGRNQIRDGVAALHTAETSARPEITVGDKAQDLIHDFVVEDKRYVELVCTYSGLSSRALFDSETLRLTRLKDGADSGTEAKEPTPAAP